MLYNSILMALTASQVLAQNQYNSDVLSSYMTAIAGSTADPSPTAAPYVPIESDGEETLIGASDSDNTSNMTDSSATEMSSVSYDTAASSAATGDYTTEYTSPAASDASGQSEYSSISSSLPAWVEPPAPSVPPTNPPVYLHIKFEKDRNKCLAIFDTSHQDNTPVKMKECYGSGHEAHWQMDASQATAIKSRVYEDSMHEEWCLDAGMDDESTNGQPVVINKCNVGLYYQTWQYTHNHLIVFDKVRGLDLQLGDMTGGGFVQNWAYTYGNQNQTWIIEPADNA